MEAHQSVLSVHQDHFNFRAIIHNVVSVLKVHFTFFNPTIKSHSSHKHTYIYTGYYNAASGQTECLRCESGRYNNLVNQSSCFRCECTFFFCVCVCVFRVFVTFIFLLFLTSFSYLQLASSPTPILAQHFVTRFQAVTIVSTEIVLFVPKIFTLLRGQVNVRILLRLLKKKKNLNFQLINL